MTTTLSELGSQYLSFFIADEAFAVNILRVKEIIEYGTLTTVPGMPACVRGVINLRGRVVPVIDLGLRFGLSPTEVTRRSCIVVVEAARESGPVVMGVAAAAVHQVLRVDAADIEALPGFGSRIGTEYLEGMTQSGGGEKFVMLLDIDRALSIEALLEGLPADDAVPATTTGGVEAPPC